MMTLDEIRRRLKQCRIDLVSKATGLHYNTVRQIRDDEDANPTYRVMKALENYLEGAK